MKVTWIMGLAASLLAGLLVFFFAARTPVSPPKQSPGETAFYSFERHIERFLDDRKPFTFSTPIADPQTGWSLVGSNQWALRGFLLTPNGRIPWQAMVHEHGTNWGVDFIKVGDQTLKSR